MLSKRICQLIPFRHLLSFGGKMQNLLFSAAGWLLNVSVFLPWVGEGMSLPLLLGRGGFGINCGVTALMCKRPVSAAGGCRGDLWGRPCSCHTPSHAKTSAPQRSTWCPYSDVFKEENQGFGVGWVTQGENREVKTVVLGLRGRACNAFN